MLVKSSKETMSILSKSKKGYFDIDYYFDENDILLALKFLTPINFPCDFFIDLETYFFYEYIEMKYGPESHEDDYYKDDDELWEEYWESGYKNFDYMAYLIYEVFYRYNISATFDSEDIRDISIFYEIIIKYFPELDYNPKFKIIINSSDIPIPLFDSLKRSEFLLYENKIYWCMGEMYSEYR